MTAQITERLVYKGQDLPLCTEPLECYFSAGRARPCFESDCTALWRGYVGRWEIAGDRLYLTALQGLLEDGSLASLGVLFPHSHGRVFAEWYSGTLRVPMGRQIEYVHMGYASRYEKDLFLKIDQGVLKSKWMQRNVPAPAGTFGRDATAAQGACAGFHR
ncbi:hypothetical protein JI739_16135 [Ramlibacter sp. AW1]|uniref:Uncharacterized protein n=1 Tax=Ramlibacter aurantiacus TaxID=2801330 RepID=A0A937D2R1_9BURK|nr:hypothetical protein [Ramlibacter aurantiacus]MBL0421879.1 hypothetical protein [Ramlibacter aurantiacus]